MSRNCCLLTLLVLCVQVNGARATPKSAPFPARKEPIPIPWQEMNERAVALGQAIVDRPTLSAQGSVEHFYGSPEHYYFYLDHPDQGVTQWRKMGAKCCAIVPRGNGIYSWADESGSEVVWETVHRGPGVRVWFAEGKVKPGPLLPFVPVKAFLILNHTERATDDGRCVLRHQADIYAQTDSKSAALLTKMMGTSAQKMAEQGLSQFQLFFAGLSWYASRHPDEAPAMLRPATGTLQQASMQKR